MSVVDRESVTQLVADTSLADARRIAGVFAGDVERLMGAAGRFASAGDFEHWRRTLHSLAGASGAVGGVVLETGARQRMALTDATPARMCEETARLRSVASETLTELEAFLDSLVASQ